MIDQTYLLEKLIALVSTPSPVGMTEKAVALVDGWLRELGFAPQYTRRGVLFVDIGQGEPRRALGLLPLMEFLAHRMTREDAVTTAQRDTRHYIKRQLTWLRRYMITWKWLSEQEMKKQISDSFPIIDFRD